MQVPGVGPTSSFYPRQLFIDNERMPRARLPSSDGVFYWEAGLPGDDQNWGEAIKSVTRAMKSKFSAMKDPSSRVKQSCVPLCVDGGERRYRGAAVASEASVTTHWQA
jgi:hypothetical protein